MPRGRKALKPIEEQIAEIDAKIDLYQSRLSAAKARRKSLMGIKEKADMDALYQAVKESGKSPTELIQSLQM